MTNISAVSCGTGLVTRMPWQTSRRSGLGLVWSPGGHDKHLGSQFWNWSGHQGTMTKISAVSAGTGMDTGVPWQTSQRSVLGLVWSPEYHDKHLSGQLWDWSGHQGAMTNISAVSSWTDLVTMVPWQTSQRSVLGLVIRVPWRPSLQPVPWSAWSAWCYNHHLSSLEPSGSSSYLWQLLFLKVFPVCHWQASSHFLVWNQVKVLQLMHTAHTLFSSGFRSSDCGEPQAGGSVCLCGNQHVLWPGPDTTGVSTGASPQHVRGKRSSAPQGQADLGWLWRSRGWRWSVGVATV